MQRLLSTALLLGLLLATAAAFAVTEELKLQKVPIAGTRVSKTFSPLCGCARRVANIRVKLRHRDTVTVTVLDAHRRAVQTLADGVRGVKGRNVYRYHPRWREVRDETKFSRMVAFCQALPKIRNASQLTLHCAACREHRCWRRLRGCSI